LQAPFRRQDPWLTRAIHASEIIGDIVHLRESERASALPG
jgi:hypothetical protein